MCGSGGGFCEDLSLLGNNSQIINSLIFKLRNQVNHDGVHEFMYAYCVYIGDTHHAAWAMYTHALHLIRSRNAAGSASGDYGESGKFLKVVCECLLVCIMNLSLVDPSESFIAIGTSSYVTLEDCQRLYRVYMCTLEFHKSVVVSENQCVELYCVTGDYMAAVSSVLMFRTGIEHIVKYVHDNPVDFGPVCQLFVGSEYGVPALVAEYYLRTGTQVPESVAQKCNVHTHV